MQKKDKETI